MGTPLGWCRFQKMPNLCSWNDKKPWYTLSIIYSINPTSLGQAVHTVRPKEVLPRDGPPFWLLGKVIQKILYWNLRTGPREVIMDPKPHVWWTLDNFLGPSIDMRFWGPPKDLSAQKAHGPRLLNLNGSIKRHEVSKFHQKTSGLDKLIRPQPNLT